MSEQIRSSHETAPKSLADSIVDAYEQLNFTAEPDYQQIRFHDDPASQDHLYCEAILDGGHLSASLNHDNISFIRHPYDTSSAWIVRDGNRELRISDAAAYGYLDNHLATSIEDARLLTADQPELSEKEVFFYFEDRLRLRDEATTRSVLGTETIYRSTEFDTDDRGALVETYSTLLTRRQIGERVEHEFQFNVPYQVDGMNAEVACQFKVTDNQLYAGAEIRDESGRVMPIDVNDPTFLTEYAPQKLQEFVALRGRAV